MATRVTCPIVLLLTTVIAEPLDLDSIEADEILEV